MAHGGLRPGAGRPKGSPNRVQADVKHMILAALETVGGVNYLARQAEQNPSAFMTLVGKVLPLQLQTEGNATVSYVIRAPSPVESAADWLAMHAPSDQREPLTIEASADTSSTTDIEETPAAQAQVSSDK